eukprot:10110-Heterococcus_DN1.PRE.1
MTDANGLCTLTCSSSSTAKTTILGRVTCHWILFCSPDPCSKRFAALTSRSLLLIACSGMQDDGDDVYKESIQLDAMIKANALRDIAEHTLQRQAR